MRDPTGEPSDAEMRRRLAEAEETIEAICTGSVDAVVVDGPSGQQVYTLESPDQPFRLFIEQMQEGALTVSRDGIIVYCNRYFADFVQKPLERVMGGSFVDFVAPDSRAHFDALLIAAAEGTARGEGCLLDPAGNELPVQLALHRLPEEDANLFGLVVTDLSERVRAQQLEVRHRAAEQANAARDQFLAVVSHELRTPLNAIVGWTQVLRARRDISDQIQRGLDIIERNAWAQTQLIDDLLDVSRVLAGKLRLEFKIVELAAVVEGAVNSAQPAADGGGIRLALELPEHPIRTRADPARLQQVISNLLSNAVQHTPQGGEIRVMLREVDNHAEIEVADTGAGIEAEFLSHIFGLFEQAEPRVTRRTGGLGLGLAIVKQLTELHGGEVRASSAGRDRGAQFVVRLPIRTRNQSETPTAAPAAGHTLLDGLRILIVEDSHDARDVIAEMLAGAGAEVLTASTAPDALALLSAPETQHVDILVSDIGLPSMDGYELIREIRSSGRSGRDLPAVALTAFAGREDRRQVLRAGYQMHIPKPVDQDELCAAIASLAGRLVP